MPPGGAVNAFACKEIRLYGNSVNVEGKLTQMFDAEKGLKIIFNDVCARIYL